MAPNSALFINLPLIVRSIVYLCKFTNENALEEYPSEPMRSLPQTVLASKHTARLQIVSTFEISPLDTDLWRIHVVERDRTDLQYSVRVDPATFINHFESID